MRVKVWLTLLLIAASLPLRASEDGYVKRGTPERHGRVWTEQAECGVPVKEGGRLVLRADMGSVNFRVGASDQVSCQVRLVVYSGSEAEARACLAHYELTARRLDVGGAYVSGKFPYGGHRGRSLGVTFDVQIPLRFNVDVETQGGGITVEKLEGELRAVTAGGDIRTGDLRGPVRVETAGGAIGLGNISQRVDARTAGGPIRVGDVKGDANLETSGGEIMSGEILGTVRAQTAGGDIALRAASGPVVVATAGGQIQLGQCGGTVRAETAGGSIHLDGARGRVEAETAGGSIDLLRLRSGVRAETAAGHILAQLDASRESFAASRLETEVGDVQVFLPGNLALNIDAMIDQAAGHKIMSDFPLTMRREGDEDSEFDAGPMRGVGALGGGGPQLSIHTTMGNIEIRKLDAAALERLKRYQESFWKRWRERWSEQGERWKVAPADEQ